eukprot:Partr_v1_DN28147_c1_g1_i1_m55069 putative Plays a central role in 2-thiolation of mcm(5)S(2)U at tRNA wobble positions of tRNA(Lys), tRNA(Glu) and tRNA(Gln). Directly binds tRNAs and probably acts by catalyzing adenylation of tRNAs, an intermediate required for 2-thiolation. It is unclear whether it acts as a sulfurtransferase that transfers sulfur from thiocarboxylated urm1 onto the uridine of tRNAs at wobble position
MPKLCELCHRDKAAIKRPKTGQRVCKECFFRVFELEIHQTIISNQLFERGERVAIGASGGKDSTVLAHVLKVLNERYDYGLDLFLLSIDEGITGYRDDSLETVKRNRDQYDMQLEILSYRDLYGWTMDEIVKEVGLKNNCTFCGVFRRQALDRGAAQQRANHIVTGHNADDIAETVLMNILRGDVARLQRCTAIMNALPGQPKRSKPFKYTYEKEIVMYAYHKKLDYFSTECIYSPNAYRGHARTYIKDLESVRPRAILGTHLSSVSQSPLNDQKDIIFSGESYQVHDEVQEAMPKHRECERCGWMSNGNICKACLLLEGLNKSKPRTEVAEGTAQPNGIGK